MTTTALARLLALLSGALVLVACGPAATTSPTMAPATQAPTADLGLPSFALPTLAGDPALEALLPDEIGGQTVLKFSMTGDSFLGTGGTGSEEIDDVLRHAGKSPSDLSVAVGGTGAVTVIAYRIEDVPADVFFQAFLQAAQEASQTSVNDVSLSGKSVKQVVSSDADIGTVYAYTQGDVLFLVGGEDVSDAILNETLSKLP